MAKTHGERKAGWRNTLIIFAIVFLVTFGYAIVRYNIFRNVPLDQIPLYVNNKALSLTAVILIGFSFLLGPLSKFWPKKFSSKLYLRKYLGVFGFGIAALHGLISLILFNPAYYPRLFTAAGKLTFSGELSMLFGVLSIFIFSMVSVTSLPSVEKTMHPKQWKLVQRLGYLAFVFVLFHVAVMGWEGWLNPTIWPAGMLPISLLAALVIIFVLIMRAVVIGRK